MNVLKFPRAYTVNVIHDENVWVGVCDDLGLVTEAETYEALTERVWEIAPELCELNGLCREKSDRIRLAFTHEQSNDERIAL
ncbi:hypothetical protein PEC302107_36120 [Pectobacterium araliae]|uniref:DUF1902 domain-containing protein n=1 Tax=Pectobacterium araliae TaxID=3073862 RepID=UPI00208BEAD8|nr:hypothetical protein PEC302107_36120 [Pectobacterium carotovorum subsp. carotovorum]